MMPRSRAEAIHDNVLEVLKSMGKIMALAESVSDDALYSEPVDKLADVVDDIRGAWVATVIPLSKKVLEVRTV